MGPTYFKLGTFFIIIQEQQQIGNSKDAVNARGQKQSIHSEIIVYQISHQTIQKAETVRMTCVIFLPLNLIFMYLFLGCIETSGALSLLNNY